jgi:hypothetical protein
VHIVFLEKNQNGVMVGSWGGLFVVRGCGGTHNYLLHDDVHVDIMRMIMIMMMMIIMAMFSDSDNV